MSDRFNVLTTGHGKEARYSVVENISDVYSRRDRLQTFIPDAGSSANAARVARLLNEEHLMNTARYAKIAEEEAAAEAATNNETEGRTND